MRVAVIGKGRTGQFVAEVLGEAQIHAIYGSQNKPTVEKLRGADVAILFVPGEAMSELMPILLDARIPVVCGATNFTLPDNFSEQLQIANVSWVVANNFSLGMCLIRRCIEQLALARSLFNADINIHEVHHVHKLDSPSGTALEWKKWSGVDCPITSERLGDVKGEHTLTVSTSSETVSLKHTAHTRRLFAEGAVWAAQRLSTQTLTAGLHDFTKLVDQACKQP